MGDLTNKPTVGGDNGTWGQELNDALDELDAKKASAASVYTKTQVDTALTAYVKSVNGVGPDGAGNVAIDPGTGTGPAVSSVNGLTGDVVLTAASVGARPAIGNIPASEVSGLAGVATTGKYTDLDPSTIPAAAIPLTQKGAASGVAPLNSSTKVASTYLGSGTANSTTFLRGDGSWATPPSGGGGSGRSPVLTVASSQLSSALQAGCDYVCDGVDDQAEINAALARASRSVDAFGGDGMIGVQLVGPYFSVADDNATSITMYPSTMLQGSGPGTIIEPKWASSTPDRGAIELLNQNTAHVRVSNLTVGRRNAVQVNGHGIMFLNNAAGDAYEVKTGGDAYLQIDHVFCLLLSQSGFYISGPGGSNARETQISHCLAWSCAERGFRIDSSDCQISDCRATGGGNFARFEISGGNSKIANCKAYFSGNRVGDGSTADGFILSSSRISIIGCDAQDCGRYGFNFTGGDVTAVGLVADSNSNKTASGGGFLIAANGMYSGLNGYNRPQTPSSPQNKPFIFSGSPQVFLTGRSGIASTTSGVHVTGSPGTNSSVTIVRDGSTLYTG